MLIQRTNLDKKSMCIFQVEKIFIQGLSPFLILNFEISNKNLSKNEDDCKYCVDKLNNLFD